MIPYPHNRQEDEKDKALKETHMEELVSHALSLGEKYGNENVVLLTNHDILFLTDYKGIYGCVRDNPYGGDWKLVWYNEEKEYNEDFDAIMPDEVLKYLGIPPAAPPVIDK